MDLTKLCKKDLLLKCTELGINNCKSKNKNEIIEMINSKNKEIITKEHTDITNEDIKILNADCMLELQKINVY